MRWHPRRLLLFIGACLLVVVVGVWLTSVHSKHYKHSLKARSRPTDQQQALHRLSNYESKNKHAIFWSNPKNSNLPQKNSNMILKFGQSDKSKRKIEKRKNKKEITFNLNTGASDMIPLNRQVPDSRPEGCKDLKYPDNLPTASIIIPFYNEWPSVLLRTVHSLVNRTPHTILKQIILVDDASDLEYLENQLEKEINSTFTSGPVVTVVRLKERQGLIRARLAGLKHVSSEVVSFFDSHMEVNEKWIEPLLNEIVKNPKTVSMAQLDYIDKDSLQYNFYSDYRTRYGFKWDMEFFETYFRPDQLKGKSHTDPLPGVLMVGPGFAVRTQYFKDIGAYDDGMKIWGGENIEFAWRTWMCGGQLLHVPCSRVGHIERGQPYSFPQGRQRTEFHNYKRAATVWMGPYTKYVYDALPGLTEISIGDLEERIKIKNGLQCKDFSWFLEHIWPELLPYEDVGPLWGQVMGVGRKDCLDNGGYLFMAPQSLVLAPCTPGGMIQQGIALTTDGLLRTTLHCIVAIQQGKDLVPVLQNCMLDTNHQWEYDSMNRLKHLQSNKCLTIVSESLRLMACQKSKKSQQWQFITGKAKD